jgi:hypothetical protein
MYRSDDDFMTTAEVVDFLELKSPQTVANWLHGGYFPGAFQAADGTWRFHYKDVEAVAAGIAVIRKKNAKGDLSPPDCDLDFEPPLL